MVFVDIFFCFFVVSKLFFYFNISFFVVFLVLCSFFCLNLGGLSCCMGQVIWLI
ncbi:hypothetical protein EC960497_A0056 [Escherichia coli 96.0497]|nr:hypothetical protein EC960497_A0056 [Escherichia coli 96.0497]